MSLRNTRFALVAALFALAAAGVARAQTLPYLYIQSCESYESPGAHCDFQIKLTQAYSQPLTVEYFTYTSPNLARGNWATDFDTSFEEPALTAAAQTYSAGQPLGGWTVGTGSVDLVGSALWQAAQMRQSLDLNGSGPGSLYVDVATDIGATYIVSFALAGNPQGAPAAKTLDVKFGATTNTYTFDTTGHSAASMGWTWKTFTITATTSVTRLEFVSTTAGAYGPAIDEVAVVKPFASLQPAASSGIDFVSTYGFVGATDPAHAPIVIPAGATSATVSVPIIDDALDEQDESMFLWATLVANGQINNNRGVIYDNDGGPSVQVDNVGVVEGDAGTTDCVFSVSLGSPSASAVSVDYQTGPRYGANRLGLAETASFESPALASGITTYAAGASFGGWTVGHGSVDLVSPQVWRSAHDAQSVDLNGTAAGSVFRDVTMQHTCCWTLDFALAGNPGAAPATKVLEVYWGGQSVGLFSFDTTGHTTTAMGWEWHRIFLPDPNDGIYRLEFVSRTSGAAGPVIDDVELTQGTILAQPSVDYLHRFGYVGANYAAAAPLVFAPGETFKQVRVPVIGDTAYENQLEPFGLRVDVHGTPLTATADCNIQDTDPPPKLSIADASTTEGDAGTRTLSFTVTLAPASGARAYVDFATSSDTATSGSDFAPASGQLTFEAGETSKSVAVTIYGDTASEVNETFHVTLSNAVGATLQRAQASGILMNDDAPVDPIFANGFE